MKTIKIVLKIKVRKDNWEGDYDQSTLYAYGNTTMKPFCASNIH
jgi:hypothetical protein